IADIDASSAARGMDITWPHFLQWPRLPAMRASTSNRAPQLWQKNTMGMGFSLHDGRAQALLRSVTLGDSFRTASDISQKQFPSANWRQKITPSRPVECCGSAPPPAKKSLRDPRRDPEASPRDLGAAGLLERAGAGSLKRLRATTRREG